MGTTLFSKNRKSQRKPRISEPIPIMHTRQSSVSSTTSTCTTTSRASSEHSHTSSCSYDPLSLHPPLALNVKPSSTDCEFSDSQSSPSHSPARSRMSQRNTAEELLKGLSENPSERGEDWVAKQIRRRQYIYDQQSQWPLKDWQSLPPGLAHSDTSSTDESVDIPTPTPRPSMLSRANTLRPTTRGKNSFQDIIMKGDWKRRGIVFGLDNGREVEEEKAFDIPEQPALNVSRWSLTP